jgi:phosphonate transport system permease protein
MPTAPDPRVRPRIGRRTLVVLALLLAGVWSFFQLDLGVAGLVPAQGGWKMASAFFARAFSPALSHETAFKPEDSLLAISWASARLTLFFAAAAMALSLVLGIVLGFFASTAWWSGGGGSRSRGTTVLAPAVYGATRALIAGMRSVHELLWALVLLIVFDTSPTTAIIAIAIPYGGTLAKIFSEMIDEAPRAPAIAMREAGASGLQAFLFGLVPAALPDMTAYTFYRFECALRSAAILGFFGFPTLGLRIKQAFQNLDYGETWTHLYVLIALIVVFDLWSGAIRRRLVT